MTREGVIIIVIVVLDSLLFCAETRVIVSELIMGITERTLK